ncbi:hypothetical protein AT727_02040 [Desulfitobacterium hafniense]|uniref:Teneurin NHL domain-containing protein n=1 Tax=Desulfitobacterium hafniense TaxID=49338 RepID=A0A0W1JQE3_DESHA|nr:cell wall-binding repeat-containing protein [Desulfitobacterium hafniense]KTE93757.1 hypothetical protein AT727_02040 [Desulfitobacterium hafniense]
MNRLRKAGKRAGISRGISWLLVFVMLFSPVWIGSPVRILAGEKAGVPDVGEELGPLPLDMLQTTTPGAINMLSGIQMFQTAATTPGAISTLIGTKGRGSATDHGDGGPAGDGKLRNPGNIAVDDTGNLYITETGLHRVRLIPKVTGTYYGISMVAGNVYTVAGTGTGGYDADGGPAASAKLKSPTVVALDPANGDLYIGDNANYRIRKVAADTGIITTVAGTGISNYTGDGTAATSTPFRAVNGLAVDNGGNLYLADTQEGRIYMIPKTAGDYFGISGMQAGYMYTIGGTGRDTKGTWGGDGAGNVAATAVGMSPFGLESDTSGDLYFADNAFHCIRKIDRTTGYITTVVNQSQDGNEPVSGPAGADGEEAATAQLNGPKDIKLDKTTGNLYIADTGNNQIRRVNVAAGKIETVAGTGTRAANKTAEGPLEGDDGAATSANLGEVRGIALDGAGDLYISEYGTHAVRYVYQPQPAPGAGPGLELTALGLSGSPVLSYGGTPFTYELEGANGLTLTGEDQHGDNYAIAGMTVVWTVVSGPASVSGSTLTVTGSGEVKVTAAIGAVVSNELPLTVADEGGTLATLSLSAGSQLPALIYHEGTPLRLDLGDLELTGQNQEGAPVSLAGGNVIWKVVWGSASVSDETLTIMNSGTVRVQARIGEVDSNIFNLAVEPGPDDPAREVGRLIRLGGGNVAVSAGDGGPLSEATFKDVTKVKTDGQGNLYIVENVMGIVRMVPSLSGTYYGVAMRAGYIYTIAGNAQGVPIENGKLAREVNFPLINPGSTGAAYHLADIAVNSKGVLYIADNYAHCVYQINPDGRIYIAAGGNGKGYEGDGGSAAAAKLYSPDGLAVDSRDNLYILDASNYRVRKVNAGDGIISTVIGNGHGTVPASDGTPAKEAAMWSVSALVVDNQDNIYFAMGSALRMVPDQTGTYYGVAMERDCVYTIAGIFNTGLGQLYSGDGGPALEAVSSQIREVQIDGAGNIYIRDSGFLIRRIDKTGIITTIGGKVQGEGINRSIMEGLLASRTIGPRSFCLDPEGNLYWANGYTVYYVRMKEPAPGLTELNLGGGLGLTYQGSSYTVELRRNLALAGWDSAGNPLSLEHRGVAWTVSGPAEVSGGLLTVNGSGVIQLKAYIGAVASNPIEIQVEGGEFDLTLTGSPALVYKGSPVQMNLNTLSLSRQNHDSTPYDLTGKPISWEIVFGQEIASIEGGILTVKGYGAVAVRAGAGGVKSNALVITRTGTAVIGTIAGNGVKGTVVEGSDPLEAPIGYVNDVAVNKDGHIYIAHSEVGSIYMIPKATGTYHGISMSGGKIYTVAGTGEQGYNGDGIKATLAMLDTPRSIAFDDQGSFYIGDYEGNRIRKVDKNGMITTVAGNGEQCPRLSDAPPGTKIEEFAGNGGLATEAPLYRSQGVSLDRDGNIYITENPNNWLRVVPAKDYDNLYGLKNVKKGHIYVVVGNGTYNSSGPAKGDGGPATKAQFKSYGGNAVFDSQGNMIIPDNTHQRIAKVTPDGILTTIAGTGIMGYSGDGGPATQARLNSPKRVAIDGADNLYISENGAGESIVRMIPARDGLYYGVMMKAGYIYTIAGGNGNGFGGDNGLAVRAVLNTPERVDVDRNGNLYIADGYNNRVRYIEGVPFLNSLTLSAGSSAPSRNLSYSGARLTYDLTKLTLSGTDLSGAAFDLSDRPVTWQVVSGPATINEKGIMTITGTGPISIAASVYGDGGLFSAPLNFTVGSGWDRDSDDDSPGTSAPEPSIPALAPLATPDGLVPGGDNTEYNRGLLDSLRNATEEERSRAQLPAGAPDLTNSAGATLVANDGLRVVIPQGAIAAASGTVRLNVGLGSITEPPRGSSSAVVLDPLKYQRQFELEGQAGASVSFNAPVTLSFPVTAADLPAGVTPGQLAVYWWNPDKNDWIKLGGVYDGAGGSLSITTWHFSTYAVMADTGSVPGRLAGRDLYDTANAVAEQGWKLGADSIILVNAQAHADALAAIPLAYKLNAPILFTGAQELPASTAEQIKKLSPQNIVLIGGTAVISQALENSLGQTYGKESILRYSGTDRFDTAALIAKALGTTGKAVMANGEEGHYADALTISSYAAYHGIPILFTQGSGLPDITVRTMNDLKVEKTVVVGGDSVVPVSVYQQLPGAVRYGGSDRYETAAMIAQELKLNLNTVYVATGKGFADALVAGNLASHTLSPLILVDHGVPDAAAGFFSANRDSIHNLVMVGGEGIINQAQEDQIRETVEK